MTTLNPLMNSHAAESQSYIPTAKAPGHWVLARLGKRVLRPGGLRGTRYLLKNLEISGGDRVVEFAPGLGVTARMIIARCPASYVGIDRDVPAVQNLRRQFPSATIIQATAQQCTLASGCATKVIGEAMLSMHPNTTKHAIMAEASRLLVPNGCYGIHELAFTDKHLSEAERRVLRQKMAGAIHNGVTPLTKDEWCELLDTHGLVAEKVIKVPFRLLQPIRIVADEGLLGAAKFCMNMLKDPVARKRVLTMRKAFLQYKDSLTGIIIIARKKEQ